MTAPANDNTNVVPFVPFHGATTYRPVFVLFEGYKRRQWAVQVTHSDGTEEVWSAAGGRKSEAYGMAKLWTQIEAKRQRDLVAIANDPIGQYYLSMSPETREYILGMLKCIQRLKGESKQ